MRFNIFFIFICICLFSCKPKEERRVERSFYYWKSSFKIDSTEMKMLDSLKVKNLYVKFFDVVWDDVHRAMPVAQVYWDKPFPEKYAIIPVIYITNEAILKTERDEIELLASRIRSKVTKTLEYTGIKLVNVKEVQFDCDWNASSREKYFLLLKELKKYFLNISATIRLHQVKYYQKTGVPPVNKGMLMFYNMAPVYNPTVENSILNTDEAEKYISDTSTYPLKLDVALPLFSWGVVFRGNQFKGLINYLDTEKISKLKFFTKNNEHSNVYMSNVDTVYQDYYFRKGDVIRIEEPDLKDLEDSKEILSPLIKTDSLKITLFHWDSTLVNKYQYETIDKIFHSYK